MPKIQHIKQPQPLAALAYEELRDAIFSGILKPGELYTELSLARDLGISRTPVREALLTLSAQGLVTFLPRKGILVREYTESDIREIFHLREILESATVEYVANSYQKLSTVKIEKAFERQHKAATEQDILSWLKYDREFHTAIAELTRNHRLVTLLQELHQIVQMVCYETFKRGGRIGEDLLEHDNIFNGLRHGRVLEAKKAMKDHLGQAMNLVLTIGKLKSENQENEPAESRKSLA